MQSCRTSVGDVWALLDVPLLHQGVHHTARRALVEEETLRQFAQADRSMLDQRFERMALRHRNVVAANPVAIAELVDTDQIRDRCLEGLGVAI